MAIGGKPVRTAVERGGDIGPAPAADVTVAKGYPAFAGKGPWRDGRRITIVTA